MPTYTVPYGTSSLSFSLPEGLDVDVISPHHKPPVNRPRQTVKESLHRSDLNTYRGLSTAAIAINDKTRPIPHQDLYPPLLEELTKIGIPPERTTLLIANGAHPPMPEDEFPRVVPRDILSRYKVISHDCDDTQNLVHLGVTNRGTPVWINRAYAQASLRIVVGNIEPHQFMGFSGGVKGAVIGLAGRDTINANHAMMTDPRSRLGEFQDNPARKDVEEMGDMLGVHFALNTILNDEKDIVHIVAGPPPEVMAAGIPLVKDMYQVEVDHPFNLLIISPGGHPKDINLYQAQKALAHASRVIRKGGTVLMAAACPEGSGDQAFENWMVNTPSLDAILDRFQKAEFRVGPHKAYLFARDASRISFYIISDMEAEDVMRLHLTPQRDLPSALETLLPALPPEAHIGIIPHGNATIPTF
ncbi:MAG: nickel-dependent lactate racemase [Chloroflexota bacterium]